MITVPWPIAFLTSFSPTNACERLVAAIGTAHGPRPWSWCGFLLLISFEKHSKHPTFHASTPRGRVRIVGEVNEPSAIEAQVWWSTNRLADAQTCSNHKGTMHIALRSFRIEGAISESGAWATLTRVRLSHSVVLPGFQSSERLEITNQAWFPWSKHGLRRSLGRFSCTQHGTFEKPLFDAFLGSTGTKLDCPVKLQ